MNNRRLEIFISIVMTVMLLIILAYFIAFVTGYTHQHTMYGWFVELYRKFRGVL